MRSSSRSFLPGLGLMSALLSKAGGPAGFPSLFTSHRPTKRYPEQSARQKLRAFRRAQGGPGLTEGTPRPLARNT